MDKQVALQRVRDSVAFQQGCQRVIDALPEDAPVNSVATFNGWMTLYATADLGVYRQLRRMLGRDFRRDGKAHVSENGRAFTVDYVHTPTGVPVSLYMDTTEAGATCRKVQTGQRVIPVYTITCGALLAA
jgi:hypothetical protein